jgi:hypothetical protein
MNKYCPRCKNTLNKKLFTEAKSRKDGLQAYCRECMKLYRIEHYRSNKQPYIDRAKAIRLELMSYLQRAKDNPCKDCNKNYPYYVMDFDHKGDKLFNVGEMVRRGSLEKMSEEMSKCDLVCSNCHRERTHQRSLV